MGLYPLAHGKKTRAAREPSWISPAGRHAVALARRGIKVTAVDLTEFLLRKARERATQAGVEVEFVREDMRRFVRPGAFDLALSMFSSFG